MSFKKGGTEVDVLLGWGVQYSDALDQVYVGAAASHGRCVSLMDGPSFSECRQQQQRAARALGGCRFLSSPPAVGGHVKSVRE